MKTSTLNHLKNTHINIRTPLKMATTGEGYFESNKNSIDAIVDNMINVLSTRVGERAMRPDFGSHLWNFVFEPSDEILKMKVDQEVRRVIGKHFPNVSLDAVIILTSDDDPNAPDSGYRIVIKPKFSTIENYPWKEISIDFIVDQNL